MNQKVKSSENSISFFFNFDHVFLRFSYVIVLLLDVDGESPDEKSIITYVALLWQSLAATHKQKPTGVVKFKKIVENLNRKRLSVQLEQKNE